MERKFFDVQNSVPIENYDTTRITRFGKIIEVSEKITPIIEPVTNDVLGVLLVMRDIKERRVAEKTKRELENQTKLYNNLKYVLYRLFNLIAFGASMLCNCKLNFL